MTRLDSDFSRKIYKDIFAKGNLRGNVSFSPTFTALGNGKEAGRTSSDQAAGPGEAGGGVLGPHPRAGRPRRGVGLFTPSPHLPSRVPAAARQAPRPRHTRLPLAARPGCEANTVPGVSPAAPLPRRPNLPPRRGAGPSSQALLTWSWPKAMSAAVTPASPTRMSVGATGFQTRSEKTTEAPYKVHKSPGLS
ncbi:translation initiation factor IF-2-like [Macaca thibetana thibetana]|uniref:translation initiation factor IF-2-like n=1 Tax=Macaca thibetana thibetana TaxID=257877 RepID=UPI0021BC4322|nr:translation initiation factor IF-2-like [Macaca thibetana thibetana]